MLSLADLTLLLLCAAVAAWFWRGHGIRERALALVRRHCEKMDVLLLDDNVALRRLSLLRDAHGRRRLARVMRRARVFEKNMEKMTNGIVRFL